MRVDTCRGIQLVQYCTMSDMVQVFNTFKTISLGGIFRTIAQLEYHDQPAAGCVLRCRTSNNSIRFNCTNQWVYKTDQQVQQQLDQLWADLNKASVWSSDSTESEILCTASLISLVVCVYVFSRLFVQDQQPPTNVQQQLWFSYLNNNSNIKSSRQLGRKSVQISRVCTARYRVS